MVETVILDPLDIHLDFNNPRFSMFEFANEEEIIKYLMNFEQIKELAFQIAENGYNTIGERIIVLQNVSSGNCRYTVLEGNRRVAALKLLFKYSFLLTSSDRKKLEQLKLNPKDFEVSCDIVNEASRDEALFKISAKHVEGIKTWSAIDKRVFYHNLYSQYRKKGLTTREALNRIKVITPEGQTAIKNAIQLLNYLTSVHEATKKYDSDLEKLTHLDTDVLVSRVWSPLKRELKLKFDDEFQVVTENQEVYHEILGLLGKAVWIDKKLDTRVFGKQRQWKEIVEKDIVIPGLSKKIKEYNEIRNPETTEVPSETDSSQNAISTGTDESNLSIPLNKKTNSGSSDNIAKQRKETKYKFFVPKESITINQQNYELTKLITLVDNDGNNVFRQSSEYLKISISCSHQNIVIKNNIIESISENGPYDIDVEYNGSIKHFKIFLNIAVNNQQQEYQVLFNQQWYGESLAKLSSNHKYFKICEVIKKLQNYNVLSTDIGNHIIIAFLLRNLIEYSTKAYSDLVDLKQSQEKLSPLVSTVKNHLVTKQKLSKTESKALNKHEIDIETLNGMIHDYKTEVSTVSIQSIGRKFSRYFSVIFDRLSEGVNNG